MTIRVSEELRTKASELVDLLDQAIPVLRERIAAARAQRSEDAKNETNTRF